MFDLVFLTTCDQKRDELEAPTFIPYRLILICLLGEREGQDALLECQRDQSCRHNAVVGPF